MECVKCNEKGISFIQYNEDYDSYYCGICGEWLEKTCDYPDCTFCSCRPPVVIINKEQELDWNRIMDLVNDPKFE